MKIICINGPNLNLLGKRDKSHYGKLSLTKIESLLKKEFPKISFTFFQSNNEGEIVERGSHNELLKLNGLYSKLYNMQFNL